jgi:hypothetical protein
MNQRVSSHPAEHGSDAVGAFLPGGTSPEPINEFPSAPLFHQVSYGAEYGSGAADQHDGCGPGTSIELLSIEVTVC